jgi:hypothetical protein
VQCSRGKADSAKLRGDLPVARVLSPPVHSLGNVKMLKLMSGLLFCLAITTAAAQEPAWNAAAFKECDRACLVGVLDGYMDAIFKRDVKAIPALAKDVRMTENTGEIEVGEGVLWRSKTELTSFKIVVADPASGEVAFQGRLKVQGRDTLALGNGWTPGSGR